MPKDENRKQDEPGEAHGVPEPSGGVDSDLAGLNALEVGERDEAEDEGEDAEKKVGGVQAGDEVEEVASRGGPAIEAESLRR